MSGLEQFNLCALCPGKYYVSPGSEADVANAVAHEETDRILLTNGTKELSKGYGLTIEQAKGVIACLACSCTNKSALSE